MNDKPTNKPMAHLRIKGRPFNLSLVNVYAPTESTSEAKKAKQDSTLIIIEYIKKNTLKKLQVNTNYMKNK